MDAVRGSPDEERKKGKEKNARDRHERENRPPREKGGRGEEQGWSRRGGGQGEEMPFSGDAAPMEPETKGAGRRKGRSPGEGSQEHRRRESAEAGGDGKGCRKRTQKLRGGR